MPKAPNFRGLQIAIKFIRIGIDPQTPPSVALGRLIKKQAVLPNY
jgi:hypothetical protein